MILFFISTVTALPYIWSQLRRYAVCHADNSKQCCQDLYMPFFVQAYTYADDPSLCPVTSSDLAHYRPDKTRNEPPSFHRKTNVCWTYCVEDRSAEQRIRDDQYWNLHYPGARDLQVYRKGPYRMVCPADSVCTINDAGDFAECVWQERRVKRKYVRQKDVEKRRREEGEMRDQGTSSHERLAIAIATPIECQDLQWSSEHTLSDSSRTITDEE